MEKLRVSGNLILADNCYSVSLNDWYLEHFRVIAEGLGIQLLGPLSVSSSQRFPYFVTCSLNP